MKTNWIKKLCHQFSQAAASAFSGGQIALAGFGGLLLGIAGATLVLTKKRREDEPEAA